MAEHFLDVLVVFVALLVLAFMVAMQEESVPLSGVIAAVLALTGGAIAALLLMRRFGQRLSKRLPRRLGDVYRDFHRGTLSGLELGRLPLITALSVAGLLCALGRWYFVAAALGISLSLPMLLLISLVNALLAAIPLTPGGLGVVEPGVTGVLMMRLAVEEAVSVALVERSISYVSIVLVRAALLFGREATKRWRPAPRSVDAEKSIAQRHR